MMELDRMRRALSQHAWLCAITLAVALAGVLIAAAGRKPSYESTAKLLINVDTLGVSISRADVKYDTAMAQVVEAVTSQAEIIDSDSLIGEAVDKLGADFFYPADAGAPSRDSLFRSLVRSFEGSLHRQLLAMGLEETITPRAALIERFKRALTVYPVRQSQIIEVSFRWSRADVPAKALETLIDLYLAKIAALNAQSNGLDLLDQQTAAAQRRLETDEQQLSRLKAENAVSDLGLERRLLMERVNGLTTQLEGEGVPAISPEGTSASAGNDAKNGNLMDDAPVTADSALAELRDNLNNLRIARAKMALQFSPGYSHLQELDAQIASAESLLRHQVDTLRQSIATYRRRLQALDLIEPAMNRIQRAVDIDVDTYETYRKATEDRRLMEEQTSRRAVQIVDPPSFPYRPIGMSRLTLLLAGAFGAVGLTLLLVFFVDAVMPWEQRGRRRALPVAAREAAIVVARDATTMGGADRSRREIGQSGHEVTPAE